MNVATKAPPGFYGRYHAYVGGGHRTLCGLNITHKWYFRDGYEVTCPSCLKKEPTYRMETDGCVVTKSDEHIKIQAAEIARLRALLEEAKAAVKTALCAMKERRVYADEGEPCFGKRWESEDMAVSAARDKLTKERL